MMHFTDIEIHRWRESGPGDDRDRVVSHLAECSDCARRYADAIRSTPLVAEPAADAQDFVAAGLRARSPRRRWVAPLAAAAVLAIAIAIPLSMRDRNPDTGDLHFRGGGIQALTPQGVVEQTDVECVWASSIVATRYRVEIGNAGGIVLTRETAAARLTVPLAPGSYWWSVTAIDDRGKPIVSSQRVAFTVRRR